jgi:WD40 repeat protein
VTSHNAKLPPIAWTAKADPPQQTDLPTSLNLSGLEFQDAGHLIYPTSPGKFVVVAPNGRKDGLYHLVNLESGETIGEAPHSLDIREPMAISADGKYLAGMVRAKGRTSVVAWSFVAGKQTASFEFPITESQIVLAQFVGVSKLLIVRSRAGKSGQTVQVLDVTTGQRSPHFVLLPEENRTSSTAGAIGVSPGGKYIASIDGGMLWVQETKTGSCVGRVDVKELTKNEWAQCDGLRFNGDGSEVAAVFNMRQDKSILCCWNFDSGRMLFSRNIQPKRILFKISKGVEEYDGDDLAWLPDDQGLLLYGHVLFNNSSAVEPVGYPITTRGRRLPLPARQLLALQHIPETRNYLLSKLDPANRNDAGPTTTASKEHWEANPTASPNLSRLNFFDMKPVPNSGAARVFFPATYGPYLVFAQDGAFHIHDLDTGKQLGSIRTAHYQTFPDVSPDGQFIAAYENTYRGHVRVWSIGSQQQVLDVQYESHGLPNLVQFVGNSRILVVEDKKKSAGLRVRVFDLESGSNSEKGQPSIDFETQSEMGSLFPNAIAVSPDGDFLATINKQSLNVHSLKSSTLVATVYLPGKPNRHNPSRCYGLTFSPNGRELAALISLKAGEALRYLCWDTASGKLLLNQLTPDALLEQMKSNEFRTYGGPMFAWSTDGQSWLVGGQILIDRQTGKEIKRLDTKLHHGRLLLNRNRIVVAARKDRTNVWAVAALDIRKGLASEINDLVAGLDGANPLVVNNDNRPKPADVPTEPAPKPPTTEPSPGPSTVVSANPNWHVVADPGPSFNVFDKLNVKLPTRLDVLYPDPVGPNVLINDRDAKERYVISLETGQISTSVLDDLDLLDPQAVSPNGRFFAAVARSSDRSVSIWSMETGKKVRAFREPDRLSAHRVSFNREDQITIVWDGSDELKTSVYDMKTGNEVSHFRVPLRSNRTSQKYIAFSPGGNQVALLVNFELQIFDLNNGKRTGHSLLPHPRTRVRDTLFVCEDVAYSPDGTMLAALYKMDMRQQLIIWKVETGEIASHRRYPMYLNLRFLTRCYDDPLLQWMPGNHSILYSGNVLLDSQTGTASWVFPDTGDEQRFVMGMEQMVIAKPVDGDKYLSLIPLDKKTLVAAIKATRTFPSVTAHPTTLVDRTNTKRIRPSDTPTPWSARPKPTDPIESDEEIIVDLGKDVDGRVGEVLIAPPAVGQIVVQQATPLHRAPLKAVGAVPATRHNLLTVVALDTGKEIDRIEIPDRDQLLDVSPDGSLLLTGSPIRFQGRTYARLDVWAPSLDRHAVGWNPTPMLTQTEEDIVDWAAFIDKRHVLSRTRRRLMKWALPECKLEYEIQDFGRVGALSPERDTLLGFHKSRGFELYNTENGERVGQLAWPYASKASSMITAAFRGDCKMAAAITSGQGYCQIIMWNLHDGTVIKEFGIPEIGVGHMEWIGDRHLLAYGRNSLAPQSLIDLENNALVWQFDRIPGANHLTAPFDGRHWFTYRDVGKTILTVRNIITESTANQFRPMDLAIFKPGDEIDVLISADIPIADKVRQSLRKTLQANGLKVVRGAGKHLRFSAEEVTVESRNVGARRIEIRNVKFKVAIFDRDGTAGWSREWSLPRGTIDVSTNAPTDGKSIKKLQDDLARVVENLPLPTYAFPKNWADRIGRSSLVRKP